MVMSCVPCHVSCVICHGHKPLVTKILEVLNVPKKLAFTNFDKCRKETIWLDPGMEITGAIRNIEMIT